MPTPEETKAADDAAKAAAETAAKAEEDAALAAVSTDAGREAIRKEREARKLETKRAATLEAELAELRTKDAEAGAAKAKADEEAAAKRGEFEKLATDRKTALDAATAERTALADRVRAYEDRDRRRIEAGLADIPDDLRAFDPGKDAALDARLAWFETAQAQLAARAGTVQIVRTPGSPRPADISRADVIEREKDAERRRYGLRPQPRQQ